MQDQTIKCPKCNTKIPLSETLTHQIKEDLEERLKREFKRERDEFVQKEKAKLWVVAQRKAKEKLAVELRDRERELADQKKRMKDLEDTEIKLRRAKRELEERERRAELELERRLDKVRDVTLKTIKKETAEEHRLKMQEKDKQMEQMKKTIDELKRKSEQGSQQVQGDAAEMNLRDILQTSFPTDTVSDVPTGVRGADLIQIVNTGQGKRAGTILWESKNTKAFSRDWVPKLRDDQAHAKSDICILATRAMPDGIETFGEMNGVLIVDLTFVIPLAKIIRKNIIRVSKMKQSLTGSGKKMEILYRYLLSPGFKSKIENIIQAFSSLKGELETERRAMHRIWSRREKQIDRVITSTSSLYGDLQGVTGDALPKIDTLELPDGESDDASEKLF